MSKTSVCEVFDLADEKGITYEDVREKTEEEAYRLLYPERNLTVSIYKEPGWDYVHKELAKVGVTLKLLHEEYVASTDTSKDTTMGYGRFCRAYREFTWVKQFTCHIDHRPAEKIECDWSGPTMQAQFVDAFTGEITKVYLFVATLPYSQYSYVEPTLDMKQNTWLKCHVRMYHFFQGSTPKLIPDNLKTGVISHPKEGDIILNEAYERLGEHYLTAIMPAGILRPKHKPSVEGTVGKVATAIIAKLRNHTFHTFDELKVAVSLALDDFNAASFQKRTDSRKVVFKTQEQPLLRPLPVIDYEVCEWIYGRKANLDSHVIYKKNRYSCPSSLIGRTVDLRITDTTLEIYSSGTRVSTHKLFAPYVQNAYSTHEEDMPRNAQYVEWDEERIMKWAEKLGENTHGVICRIFASVKIKEQAYNPSLSVLRLAKTYSPERLERACAMALAKVSTPRWRHLKQILESNQDKMEESEQYPLSSGPNEGYVWGADFYGGGK
jgi:transposase